MAVICVDTKRHTYGHSIYCAAFDFFWRIPWLGVITTRGQFRVAHCKLLTLLGSTQAFFWPLAGWPSTALSLRVGQVVVGTACRLLAADRSTVQENNAPLQNIRSKKRICKVFRRLYKTCRQLHTLVVNHINKKQKNDNNDDQFLGSNSLRRSIPSVLGSVVSRCCISLVISDFSREDCSGEMSSLFSDTGEAPWYLWMIVPIGHPSTCLDLTPDPGRVTNLLDSADLPCRDDRSQLIIRVSRLRNDRHLLGLTCLWHQSNNSCTVGENNREGNRRNHVMQE